MTWLQLPQCSSGADAGAALVTGVQATAAVADSSTDSSADHTPLMRHMGANRCMRRPQAVIPLVTPWSRYLLRGLTIRGRA